MQSIGKGFQFGSVPCSLFVFNDLMMMMIIINIIVMIFYDLIYVCCNLAFSKWWSKQIGSTPS